MKTPFDSHIYREFQSSEEAEQWALEHYADLLKLNPESDLYKTIFSYTGSWFSVLNRLLRSCPPINSEDFSRIDFSEYADEIDAINTINDTLHRYSLPENTVAYRFTHRSDITGLCRTRILRKGLKFADKAFLSTTLVRKLLEPFGKEHRCNCVLKLYLPKGLPGAYVSFKTDKTRLNEQEFLLPPNVRFQIIKIHAFTFPTIIECKAICDNKESEKNEYIQYRGRNE